MTQKIKKSELHGNPKIMAIFSHGNPSAAIPTQFNIQKTTNEPLPYAFAFCAVRVSGAGEFANGIWKAKLTRL